MGFCDVDVALPPPSEYLLGLGSTVLLLFHSAEHSELSLKRGSHEQPQSTVAMCLGLSTSQGFVNPSTRPVDFRTSTRQLSHSVTEFVTLQRLNRARLREWRCGVLWHYLFDLSGLLETVELGTLIYSVQSPPICGRLANAITICTYLYGSLWRSILGLLSSVLGLLSLSSMLGLLSSLYLHSIFYLDSIPHFYIHTSFL
eukprot:13779-Heterococcus_DN1.PRE.1